MNQTNTTYLATSNQPTQAHMGPLTNGGCPGMAGSSSIKSPNFALHHGAKVQSTKATQQKSTATQANATYPLIVPVPSARVPRSSKGL